MPPGRPLPTSEKNSRPPRLGAVQAARRDHHRERRGGERWPLGPDLRVGDVLPGGGVRGAGADRRRAGDEGVARGDGGRGALLQLRRRDGHCGHHGGGPEFLVQGRVCLLRAGTRAAVVCCVLLWVLLRLLLL